MMIVLPKLKYKSYGFSSVVLGRISNMRIKHEFLMSQMRHRLSSVDKTDFQNYFKFEQFYFDENKFMLNIEKK